LTNPNFSGVELSEKSQSIPKDLSVLPDALLGAASEQFPLSLRPYSSKLWTPLI
jgi:hypothetical protein